MTDQARNGTVVGVIGLGNAGYAVASAFAKLSPVHGYDLNGDKRTSASQGALLRMTSLTLLLRRLILQSCHCHILTFRWR
jgi:UDP-N-acetyl-D-mannosaminuronate dehydrogenase